MPCGSGCSACGACPAFPMHQVIICFQVNACSSVQIDVGCPTTDGTCASQWHTGVPLTSWGRRARVVTFDQHVQEGAYIRITTCANAESPAVAATSVCVDNCGLGAPVGVLGVYTGANKLLRYSVDGRDLVRYLGTVLAQPEQSDGCVYVGCSAASTCCVGTPSLFASMTQIPWGAEIMLGPIGTRDFVPLPVV
jgi:hypothetical protein